ncbi:MAG TPA: helix-turn-helix domain-containing protein [Terracidiphilus sp.]|jgi:cytoskeletal protein RodZ
MSSFGEDLRMERMSRGIALEHITAVTKISQHHLVALEQERFRQLPGGILNKGIIRGYASAVGLDQQDWTERFMKAWRASGQSDEGDWTAFASNVGKARLQQREAAEFRIKWLGVLLLLGVVAFLGFIAVRLYGVKAGWWQTLIPSNHVGLKLHSWYDSARVWVGKFLA